MSKTIATLPFVAAILASGTLGLEIVSQPQDDSVETVALDALFSSMQVDLRRSRLRRVSHAAASLYTGRTDSASLASAKSVAGNEWRPLFEPSAAEKGSSIRRFYPSKARGKAHLASVNPRRRATQSRRSSMSSAASLRDTPPASPTLSSVPLSAKTSPFANQRGILESFPDTGLPTLKCLKDARQRDKDDTPTRSRRSNSSSAAPLRRLDNHTKIDAKRHPIEAKADTRSGEACAASAPAVPVHQPAFTKGHNRNESIASVWTVDSSPSSSGTPSPPNCRKPLHVQTRPLLPNFASGPLSAPLDSTFDRVTGKVVGRPLPRSIRPPIPPRSSSRNSSNSSSSRPKTLPANTKFISIASESWDDDFSEAAFQVPQSVQQSQSNVRNHLWQFRQFSIVIERLKRLRARQRQTPSSMLPEDSAVWREVDAVLAIASRGESSESVNEIQYDGAQDDTISRMLGQFRQDGGKIRLTGGILTTLIDKATRLVNDIEQVI